MTLNAKSTGRGEPLLLLHGLFGSLDNLGALARELAENFTVHSLDLPNHGRSPWSEQTDLTSMTAEVLHWLDQQGLQRVHLLGHSLGGKVAMELALTHPQRVGKLIVVDMAPVAYESRHNSVFAGLSELDPAQLKSRSDADRQLRARIPEASVRGFLLKNLVRAPENGFAWRMNLPVIRRDYPRLIAANSNAVFPGETLFIKGGDSDYIREEHRDEILGRFPKANVRVVAGTGHWLHAEKPTLVGGLVNRFLQQD